jgi:hypothetical protein
MDAGVMAGFWRVHWAAYSAKHLLQVATPGKDFPGATPGWRRVRAPDAKLGPRRHDPIEAVS